MTSQFRHTALGFIAALGLSGTALAGDNVASTISAASVAVPLVLDATDDVRVEQAHGRRYGHWHRYRGRRYWHAPRSYRSYRYGYGYRYGHRYHPRRYYGYRY